MFKKGQVLQLSNPNRKVVVVSSSDTESSQGWSNIHVPNDNVAAWFHDKYSPNGAEERKEYPVRLSVKWKHPKNHKSKNTRLDLFLNPSTGLYVFFGATGTIYTGQLSTEAE